MASYTAMAKKAAKKILGQALSEIGFIGFGDRAFVRVRGDLIDCVGVQFGRAAECFYLHFSVKLAADPIDKDFSSYRIGKRVRESDVGRESWVVFSNKTIDDIFCDMAGVALVEGQKYFSSISDVRDYVVEVACDVNSSARLYEFDLAVALAHLNKKNKVIQICEQTMKVMSSAGVLPDDERQRIYSLAAKLRSAATQDQFEELLSAWRGSKLELISINK